MFPGMVGVNGVILTVVERKAIEVHKVPGHGRCNILKASAVLDVQVIS